MTKDYVIRARTKDVPLRAFAASTKEMVEQARRIHHLTPLTSAALGRVLTATAMMGQMLKSENSKLTMQLKGDGPIGYVLATGNGRGQVKGYVGNPQADLPLKSTGKLNVGAGIGQGTLNIIMDLGLKDPYVGSVALVNGEVADDLTHYFAISEQTPSAVSLGVLVDRDQSIRASGGFIIQVLPECPDSIIDKLEENILQLPPITKMLDDNNDPVDVLKMVLKDFEIQFYGEQPVEYFCDCNRERLERVMISIGEQELINIIKEDGKADLKCHFCNREYHFTRGDLERLLFSAKAKK